MSISHPLKYSIAMFDSRITFFGILKSNNNIVYSNGVNNTTYCVVSTNIFLFSSCNLLLSQMSSSCNFNDTGICSIHLIIISPQRLPPYVFKPQTSLPKIVSLATMHLFVTIIMHLPCTHVFTKDHYVTIKTCSCHYMHPYVTVTMHSCHCPLSTNLETDTKRHAQYT